MVDRYAYDSWGEATSNDKTDEHVPQQLRYKGLYYDEKLSWYWTGGRYYDPETERYLQPEGDPSFIYASDNPAGPPTPGPVDTPNPSPTPTTTSTPTPAPNQCGSDDRQCQIAAGIATRTVYGYLRYAGTIAGKVYQRASSVFAILNKDSYRNEANSGSVSGGIQKLKPYERCHLLAKQLSGDNKEKANFVFCWKAVNDPVMKRYENIVKNLILGGDVVAYSVVVNYDDSHGIAQVPFRIEMAAYSNDQGTYLFDTFISNTKVPHESPGTRGIDHP